MQAFFRCRLNNVDHYQAKPIPEFDPPLPISRVTKPEDAGLEDNSVEDDTTTEPSKISVLRVFGATDTGQKVLMHIHGVLQYTYIEYTGGLHEEDVALAIDVLHKSIDHALAISFRQDPYAAKSKYVAHISLVKGVPFYGFYVGYKLYLKIYLLNPQHMTRLADLLREGAVMMKVLQPYESHMQYIAQWMCDYNLYGCAYIECSKVRFRSPVPDFFETSEVHPWHNHSIPSEMVSDEVMIPKQSYCALEVDVRAEDIINRHAVKERSIHNDFIELNNPELFNQKTVESMRTLWEDETKRRKARLGLKDANTTPFPPEVLVTMSAELRNSIPPPWIHEQEFRDKVQQLMDTEHADSTESTTTYENFVEKPAFEEKVQTAFESVEDLYSHNMAGLLAAHERRNATRSTQVLVDESVILDKDRIEGEGDGVGVSPAVLGSASDSSETSAPSGSSTSSDSNVKESITPDQYAALGIRLDGDVHNLEDDAFELPKESLLELPKEFVVELPKEPVVELPKEPVVELPKESVVERPKAPVVELPKEPLLAKQPMKSILKRPRAQDDAITPRKKARFLEDTDAQTAIVVPARKETAKDHSRLSEEQALENLDPNFQDQTDTDVPQQVEAPNQASQGGSQQSRLRFVVVKDPNDPNTIKRLSQKSDSLEKPFVKPHQPSSSRRRKRPGKSLLTSSTRRTTIKSPRKPVCLLGKLNCPSKGRKVLMLATPPPISRQMKTMQTHGLPTILYQEAYYSKQDDVPEISREYAGKEFKLESRTVPFLPEFDSEEADQAAIGTREPTVLDRLAAEFEDDEQQQSSSYKQWSIAVPPPSRAAVKSYFAPKRKILPRKRKSKTSSSIQGPTQVDGGFKYSSKQQSTSVQHETQYMSVMSLEVHVNTRGKLAPNPEHDEISCVFWCIQSDDKDMLVNAGDPGIRAGVLALSREDYAMGRRISHIVDVDVEEEQSELELLTRIVDIVRYWDPDILTGYEVHMSSWGYLIERARLKYDLNFCDDISRMKSHSHGRFGKDEDRWGFNHTSTIRVTGRHTINIWRAMRSELNLLQYTMENVTYHLLHKRIPHYNFADLTYWYKSATPRNLAKVVNYFLNRTQIDLRILEANELVPRTSEQARLIGIDWFSVISRGSQYKVENIMFRIAKPENLMLVSPSRRQVGGQNALECLPLVMEPRSNFYTSPMLVFDFQSLYPSIIIAYNYCYSTFLGRVVDWRGANKMGFMNYERQQRLLELLKDDINIAPNGIMYAKQHIRRSLLAKMLAEILETRVMVKSGMKQDKDDKTLQRLLNNRQLALKLIANVTYGYTSASFSGRMPCSEIADSIVQTGRETLEKAIALIHSVKRWNAEVVYGDTDSLFVYLKGRTREQAFTLGKEIADAITKSQPKPVKLKFEKVYHPCVLLAKKRYVGLKYESPDQTKPEFEAKGIETVRRDGTPAEQKIEEVALKLLFRSADLSQVKQYFQTQCTKIMLGKVSVQDFCFAREVKLGTYSDRGPPPPGALISARKMLEDPRLEPQYGERVPYVVVTGGPKARLIDRCVAPDVLLNDPQQELDAEYYIEKNIIPPLERIFNLVGANVRSWYDEMPKFHQIRQVVVEEHEETSEEEDTAESTLETYMNISLCMICRSVIEGDLPLCTSCEEQPIHSVQAMQLRLNRAERKTQSLERTCRKCAGFASNEPTRCDSKDCPVFYSRVKAHAVQDNLRDEYVPISEILSNEAFENNDLEW